MSQQVIKLLLPFAVPAEDRVKAFTKDMEKAAAFYFAESEREKGEGRILKKPAEELVFVAEACYPIWLVPWRKRTLFFDGLGITTHTLSYDIVPDINAFVNDIRGSVKTREAYSTVLFHNANYFQDFAGKEEKAIEGLITSPDFIQDFVSYLPEAEEIESSIVNKAVFSPSVEESSISTSIEELSDFRARLTKDIKDLSKGMKILSMATREQVKALREEIREIHKKFEEKIERVRPIVTERVRKIQEKYDEEITRVSKNFERQLRLIHKDRVKLEKTQERLTVEIDRCEAEIKSCRLRKDEAGEPVWREKLEKTRKKLPIIEKSIQDIDRKIENVETAKKLEISQLRLRYDARIEKAMKDLRELEAAREARVRMKQQETASLEDTTSTIVNQMNEMAKSKKAALKELDVIGAEKRGREFVLVYLPLYFACYETELKKDAELKKRYVVYPPSIVGSLGILTKLKSVFGATKMKSFLQHRSKAITALLNQLVTLIRESPVFEKEINDAGVKVNILRTTESRVGIKRGLEELRSEKWISESELQTLSELL